MARTAMKADANICPSDRVSVMRPRARQGHETQSASTGHGGRGNRRWFFRFPVLVNEATAEPLPRPLWISIGGSTLTMKEIHPAAHESLRAFARRIGYSAPHVSRLVAAGLPRDQNKRVPIATALAWVEEYRRDRWKPVPPVAGRKLER